MAKTLLFTSSSFTISTTASRYLKLLGNFLVTTSETDSQINKFHIGGTLSELQVRTTSNATTSASTVITRKNLTTSGNQSVSIPSGTAGLHEDTTNSDTVTANDKWGYRIITGSAANIVFRVIGMTYDASSDTVSKLGNGTATSFAVSTTYYSPIAGSEGTVHLTSETTGAKVRIRKSGTFKNFIICVGTASSQAHTLKFRKNGADSGVSISLTASTTGHFEDTSSTVSVSAGDDVNWSLITGSNITSLALFGPTVDFITTDSFGLLVNGVTTPSSIAKTLTRYWPLGGSLSFGTAESDTQIKGRANYTFSELGCYVTTNDTAANDSYVKLRVASSSTSLSIDIDSGVTGVVLDSTNTATSSTGDLINLEVKNNATSGGSTKNLDFMWTSVYYTEATATLYERPITESSISVSDSNTRLLTAMRTSSESSISASDSNARLLTAMRTLTESSISVSDARARLLTAYRTLSESSIAVNDSLARTFYAFRTLSEPSITVNDSLTRLLTAFRIISESTISVSDLLVAGLLYSRPVSEAAISVSDSLTRMGIYTRNPSENVSVSDSLARLLTAMRTLTEPSISVSGGSATGNRINPRSISEPAISISDTLARMAIFQRVLTESSIAVSDSLARLLTAMRILSEPSISVSDSLARTFYAFRTLTGPVSVSDSLARMLTAMRTLTGPVSVSDLLARMGTYYRILTEAAISVSETVARQIVPHVIINENVIVSDSLARLLTAMRTCSESVTISADSLTAGKIRVRIITESAISVSDTVARWMKAFRVLGETVIISDVLVIQGPDYEIAVYITDKGYSNALRTRITFVDRHDENHILYQYDSFNTDNRPFNILGASVRLAQGEIGQFTIEIEDSAKTVVKENISFGTKVQIDVRKEYGVPWTRLMTGFVRRLGKVRHATDTLQWQVAGIGTQVVFNERITNFKRAAKRSAVDSIDPLPTDSRMFANNLFKDLIQSTDILPLRRPSLMETGGFTLDDISDEVKDFIAQVAPGLTDAASVANAFADLTGALWGCNAEGNPYFRYPTQNHSGIIIKDDPQPTDSALITSINLDTFDYFDTIDLSEGFANRLYVLNAVDTKSTASSSQSLGSTTLATRGIAQQFVAGDNNITGAAFILSKVGNPTNTNNVITGRLRADNNGYPTGATLASFEISLDQVNTSKSTIFVNDIKPQNGTIIPGNKYWWYLLNVSSSESNTIRWHHDNDQTTINRFSAIIPNVDLDPTKPGSQLQWQRSDTGPVYAFSTFSSVKHILEHSDPESIRDYGLVEGIVDLPAFEDDATFQKALVQILRTSSKPKRIYNYARVTIPTQRLFLPGELVTLIDSKADMTSEKNVMAEIAQVQYIFDTGTNAMGCKYVDVLLMGFVDKVLDDYIDSNEC